MKPSLALDQQRDAVRDLPARYRAANLRVFGSVVHGRDTESSDLDLLVDTLPGATLFDLGGYRTSLKPCWA
nr:nucleotidyltransferase domain-containing protein [Asticcacaulis sp.]